MNIFDKYEAQRGDFINVFLLFKHMSNGHFRRTIAVERWISLHESTKWLVHSMLCGAGLKIHEFEKLEIEKILVHHAIKRGQTDWAAPFVFAPKSY